MTVAGCASGSRTLKLLAAAAWSADDDSSLPDWHSQVPGRASMAAFTLRNGTHRSVLGHMRSAGSNSTLYFILGHVCMHTCTLITCFPFLSALHPYVQNLYSRVDCIPSVTCPRVRAMRADFLPYFLVLPVAHIPHIPHPQKSPLIILRYIFNIARHVPYA